MSEPRPVTAEEVERVAEAIMVEMRRNIGRRAHWPTEPERSREAWRQAARAALAAYLVPPGPRSADP